MSRTSAQNVCKAKVSIYDDTAFDDGQHAHSDRSETCEEAQSAQDCDATTLKREQMRKFFPDDSLLSMSMFM